jgi:asparagine synthetase B (glutamine-hydrolysing)
MFAIAIWDERASRLALARDRAGKPLFYYRDDRLLAFASEIKSFFGHPDIPIEPVDAVPVLHLWLCAAAGDDLQARFQLELAR